MSSLSSPDRLPPLTEGLFRPNDTSLSDETRSLVQTHRLLCLIGAFLVLLFTVPYAVGAPDAVDPIWARGLVSGALVGLFLLSYGSRHVRQHIGQWVQGGLYGMIGWFTVLTTLNRFDGDYAIGLLFLYAVLGFVVSLGARSIRPVLRFFAFGFLLIAGGLGLAGALEVSPWVVLGSAATVALVEGVAIKSQIGVRERIRDREAELREMSEWLNSIIEASPDAIFVIDLDGAIQLWNPAAERIFGWSEEEVLGEPLPIVPDEKMEEYRGLRERVHSGESFSGVELRRQRKDGTPIDVNLSTAPLHDEDGAVVGIMATLEDITEQKERKRELRAQELQLQQIRENVTDVVWMSVPDRTEMEFVSEAFENVWGQSTDKLTEQPELFVEGIHPADRARVRSALETQKEAPDAYDETYRVVQPDGEVRWVRDRAAGVYDDEGRLRRIVGVATDVTKRKQAERELHDTKRLLEKTLESLSEAVIVVDPSERRVVTCNAAVEDIFGFKKEELIGEGTEVLYPSREAHEHFGRVSERALNQQGQYTGEHQMRHKEGGVIETQHTVTPLWGEEWPNGVVSVIRDITERKNREQALREERDLLRRVFQTSPTAITIFDREGDFVRLSDRAEDVLGLDREEATGRSYNDPDWEITAPDGAPMADDDLPFARVRATGAPVYDVEHAIEWPDGTRRLLSVSGAPLFDAEEKIEGAVFHIEDITERREQQRALCDREQKTTALYDATQRLVKAERREEVASQIEELIRTTFHYSLNGVYFARDGTLVPACVSPDIEARWPEMPAQDVDGHGLGARAFRSRETVVVGDLQDLDADLEYGDLRSGACVPIGDHGVITVASTERRDIDAFDIQLMEILATDAAVVLDRIEREEELRLFRKMVEHAHDAILVTASGPLDDPGPEIQYVNPSFSEMTGYDYEEAVGRSGEIVRGPNTEPWVIERMRNRVRRGLPAEAETINYRKDGTPFINQWNVAPIENEEGEIIHLVSVQRDVTEKRRMQERLLEVQEEERRRIDQEIHDEMGGLFASLQMTLDLARLEAREEGLSTEHFDQMETFISELSTAARTISRKLNPNALSDYGLAAALPSLIEEMREKHDLTVELHSEVEAGERFSSLVERTVFWVVQEALINVARHAETDTGQLIVNKGKHKLSIHVIDDGIGFDPSAVDTDESYGIRGIRERVERLNGELELEAAPDEGTRISVTLPLTISSLPT